MLYLCAILITIIPIFMILGLSFPQNKKEEKIEEEIYGKFKIVTARLLRPPMYEDGFSRHYITYIIYSGRVLGRYTKEFIFKREALDYHGKIANQVKMDQVTSYQ